MVLQNSEQRDSDNELYVSSCRRYPWKQLLWIRTREKSADGVDRLDTETLYSDLLRYPVENGRRYHKYREGS